ncbi:MAG: lipopolysaccharide ABC transporter ATP-binding protein, partial [Verrucomicrobiae bacterium]|nr:lipopolysaccharide ABC transporter ATP-binding protein [Verrucomicrobiae bacterium]
HYLPQEPSVFQKLSACENLLLVLERSEPDRKQRLQRAMQLLDKLGLAPLTGYEISAGSPRFEFE